MFSLCRILLKLREIHMKSIGMLPLSFTVLLGRMLYWRRYWASSAHQDSATPWVCPCGLPGVLSQEPYPRSFWATLPVTSPWRTKCSCCGITKSTLTSTDFWMQLHPLQIYDFVPAPLREQGPMVHRTYKWHFCSPSKKHFLNSLQTLSCFPIFLLHDFFFCRACLLCNSLPRWCIPLYSHTLFLPHPG